MARKLDEKAVKTRIKENKTIMKNCRVIVAMFMKDQDKVTAKEARDALSTFIKAATAMQADNVKLARHTALANSEGE